MTKPKESVEEERDRYRAALERIVWEADPANGGVYCYFCEADLIAKAALDGREHP